MNSSLSKLKKIDTSYLLRGGFWIGFGQFFATAANILIFLFLGNHLSKETFGDYRLVISISGIISIFFLNGLNASVTQAVAKNVKGILRRAVSMQLIWSALPFLAALSISGYYFYLDSKPHLALAIFLIGIVSPISNCFNTYLFYLNGLKDFKKIGLYTTIVAIINLAAVTIAIYFHGGLNAIVLAVFGSTLLSNFILYQKTVALEPICDNEQEIKHYLDFGKKISFSSAIITLSQYFDNILVYHFFGPAELAIYSFAKLIPDSLKNVTKIINPLAMPRFSKYDKKNIPDINFKTFALTFSLFLVAIAYMALPEKFFLYFFPLYGDSIVYSKIYALSIVGLSSIIPTTFFTSQASEKIIFNYNLTTSIFKLAVLSLGMAFYGLWGAIISLIASSAFSLFYSLILIKKTK
ncbi:oligosaccharide flippase family protein [Candidatus Falkowbacteria bacterium]|nr:oligosaccharide flippase family protein [Candidatus Falkowbacteria bacterium]